MTKTIVISSPRSGLNYLRWIMESLTNKPTPGCTRLIENKKNQNYLFHRTHDAKRKAKFPKGCYKAFYSKSGKELYKKSILLLRNPLELYGCYKKNERLNTMEMMRAYINNLKAFDKFKRKKIKIYYEDLIYFPKLQIKRVLNFLGLQMDIENINFNILAQNSLRSYNTKGHNKSKSDAKSLIYYTPKLSKKEIKYILNYLHKRINNKLWQKYMKRYEL